MVVGVIERVVKSRRMIWAGHVAWMGRREVCTECWWEARGKEAIGETQTWMGG
jgi:hypothetical protein